MNTASTIEQKINKLPLGEVFSSFDLAISNTDSERQALSRLERKGLIQRIEGVQSLYYKPKKGLLGNIKPTRGQIVNALLNGKNKGYKTGLSLYNNLGLTTQVPGIITIATTASPQKKNIAGVDVVFTKAKGPINKTTIPLLQTLDILQDVKNIPDADANFVFKTLLSSIKSLSSEQLKTMLSLSAKYPKKVQSLLGAILELINKKDFAHKIKNKLNPRTVYNIGLTEQVLPNKSNWNIV